MTKLTAANSPLLNVVKSEFNKPIFQRASKIANAEGEAATVEYLLLCFNEESKPAARRKYSALIPVVPARIHRDNSLHYDGPDPLKTRSVVPDPEWVEAANRARNAKRPTAITPGELGIIAARAEVGAAPAPSMGMIRLNALIEREANIRLIAEDAARRDLIDISPDPLAVDRRATLRRCFINDAMREKIFKRSRPDAVNVIWDYAFYMGFDTPNF